MAFWTRAYGAAVISIGAARMHKLNTFQNRVHWLERRGNCVSSMLEESASTVARLVRVALILSGILSKSLLGIPSTSAETQKRSRVRISNRPNRHRLVVP